MTITPAVQPWMFAGLLLGTILSVIFMGENYISSQIQPDWTWTWQFGITQLIHIAIFLACASGLYELFNKRGNQL